MLGFLNVNKPAGITSNAVVQKIKKKFHINKIGHFGTLDPMASGVLPLAIGKATRLFEYSLQKKKGYIATFEFGYLTDTLDATGKTIDTTQLIPCVDDIVLVASSMVGAQDQIPPNYSAKNIDGKRAYDLARMGIEFELQPKKITIYKFDLLKQINPTTFVFNIECSSGTYIRSVGRDLGAKLGSLVTMTALERTMAGSFDTSTAIGLNELLDMSSIDEALISPDDVFKTLDIICVNQGEFNRLRNGIKIDRIVPKDSFVKCDGRLVGVAFKSDRKLKLDIFLDE